MEVEYAVADRHKHGSLQLGKQLMLVLSLLFDIEYWKRRLYNFMQALSTINQQITG